MATTPHQNTVSQRFFQPLFRALSGSSGTRKCYSISDQDWVNSGVQRLVNLNVSGRDFLQSNFSYNEEVSDLARSSYFDSLKSVRREKFLRSVLTELVKITDQTMDDPFDEISELKDFELHAGDGHFHASACHDQRNSRGKKTPVGHYFGLNLRSGSLNHLGTSHRGRGHDMSMLASLSTEELRQRAPKGKKVLWIWDRAGIDFRRWYKWKQAGGIYFLSRPKSNSNLPVIGDSGVDYRDSRNAGVIDNLIVGMGGVSGRLVRWKEPETGEVWEFMTNLPTSIPPGVIVQLYQRRWDIEKSFDELKNKLHERKAWATSITAKKNHAMFACLTFNLGLLLDDWIARNQDITNLAEQERKDNRARSGAPHSLPSGRQVRSAFQAARRMTQRSVKFWRWIRTHLYSHVHWDVAVDQLRRAYLKL